LAAEADHEFAWNQLKTIQADMYAVGPANIKFVYYGAEGALPARPIISTQWIDNAADMADIMDRARVHCVCGCFVDVDDILAAALKETRNAPVQAIIIVGDRFHGDAAEAITHAKQLRTAGARLFVFQQGRGTADVFRTLAEQTGGAFFQFNPAVERVAEKLPGLLEGVAHFAIGGMKALENQARGNESAVALLEQMTAQIICIK
jgi:hypothetical protein